MCPPSYFMSLVVEKNGNPLRFSGKWESTSSFGKMGIHLMAGKTGSPLRRWEKIETHFIVEKNGNPFFLALLFKQRSCFWYATIVNKIRLDELVFIQTAIRLAQLEAAKNLCRT